jgi:hypothetical protein
MIKEKIDGLGEFEFYSNYFIGRMYEGVNAGSSFVDAFSELIQRHYSGRPTIYISDRVNSYSLDPIATNELIKRNNIRYAGVVVYTQQQRNVFSYEKRILQGVTIRSFESLPAAISWTEQKSLELQEVCA